MRDSDVAAGDWGLALEEAHFPETRGVGASALDSDDPATLPAVQAAKLLGFEPAPEAPLYCYLPAVWPNHSRAWIRDIRVRHALVSCNGEPSKREPWSTWDYFEVESDVNSSLTHCGFPPRPPGRLWLLKSPPHFASLDATLRHLYTAAESAGLRMDVPADFAAHVAREVELLFTPRP